MTIVVAGATGLAGSAIVRAYEKAGKEVIGINRSVCDLLDRDATIDFIKKAKLIQLSSWPITCAFKAT
jgi:GDP-L-fucose synthase